MARISGSPASTPAEAPGTVSRTISFRGTNSKAVILTCTYTVQSHYNNYREDAPTVEYYVDWAIQTDAKAHPAYIADRGTRIGTGDVTGRAMYRVVPAELWPFAAMFGNNVTEIWNTVRLIVADAAVPFPMPTSADCAIRHLAHDPIPVPCAQKCSSPPL